MVELIYCKSGDLFGVVLCRKPGLEVASVDAALQVKFLDEARFKP